MANKIAISVAKHPHQDGVVNMRQITVRENYCVCCSATHTT